MRTKITKGFYNLIVLPFFGYLTVSLPIFLKTGINSNWLGLPS